MLAFLPAFEGGDFQHASESYLKSGHNPVLVDNLISEVYDSGFVLPFDWPGWDFQGALDRIDEADLLTLRKLMTTFVRGDRFSGGAKPNLCSNGTVERVLRRLKSIANTDEKN